MGGNFPKPVRFRKVNGKYHLTNIKKMFIIKTSYFKRDVISGQVGYSIQA